MHATVVSTPVFDGPAYAVAVYLSYYARPNGERVDTTDVVILRCATEDDARELKQHIDLLAATAAAGPIRGWLPVADRNLTIPLALTEEDNQQGREDTFVTFNMPQRWQDDIDSGDWRPA